MENTYFEVNIYVSPLSLLKGETVDIEKEVMNMLDQTDYYWDKVFDSVFDYACDKGMDENVAEDQWANLDSDALKKCVTVDTDSVDYNFGETAECGSLDTVAFSVECEFDVEKCYDAMETQLANDDIEL